MAPNWTPLCRAMQKYCEAFFAAVERWRNYDDKNLLVNRIHLIETSYKIFAELCQKSETYEFDIVWEYRDVKLLPPTLSSAGDVYVENGDKQAFDASKKIVPAAIFNRIGAFFQVNLLKGLAGFKEEILKTANLATRKSLTIAIEKLLLIPEDGGSAHFVFKMEGESDESFTPYPMEFITMPAKIFADFLADSKHTVPSTSKIAFPSTSKATTKQKADNSTPKKSQTTGRKKSLGEEKPRIAVNNNKIKRTIEEDGWLTSDHDAIGKKVGTFVEKQTEKFGKRRQLIFGEVRKVAPESIVGAHDEVYYIVWENETTTEISAGRDYQNAIDLYDCNTGWDTLHKSVNTPVAKEITNTTEVTTSSGRKRKAAQVELLHGHVFKFSSTGQEDRYYLLWDNGDEEIVVEEEFQTYTRLYKQAMKAKEAAKKKKSQEITPKKEKKEKDSSKSSDSNSKNKNKTKMEVEDDAEESEDEIIWLNEHPSIGIPVAASFIANANRRTKVFAGKVTRYANESKPNANDQLYHIVWEDGDEEDYDELQLALGKELYEEKYTTKQSDAITPTKKARKTSSGGSKVKKQQENNQVEDDEVMIVTGRQTLPKEKEALSAPVPTVVVIDDDAVDATVTTTTTATTTTTVTEEVTDAMIVEETNKTTEGEQQQQKEEVTVAVTVPEEQNPVVVVEEKEAMVVEEVVKEDTKVEEEEEVSNVHNITTESIDSVDEETTPIPSLAPATTELTVTNTITTTATTTTVEEKEEEEEEKEEEEANESLYFDQTVILNEEKGTTEEDDDDDEEEEGALHSALPTV